MTARIGFTVSREIFGIVLILFMTGFLLFFGANYTGFSVGGQDKVHSRGVVEGRNFYVEGRQDEVRSLVQRSRADVNILSLQTSRCGAGFFSVSKVNSAGFVESGYDCVQVGAISCCRRVSNSISGLVIDNKYGFVREAVRADQSIRGVKKTPEGVKVASYAHAFKTATPWRSYPRFNIPELVCPEKMQVLSKRDVDSRPDLSCKMVNEYVGVYCCEPSHLKQVVRRKIK